MISRSLIESSEIQLTRDSNELDIITIAKRPPYSWLVERQLAQNHIHERLCYISVV